MVFVQDFEKTATLLFNTGARELCSCGRSFFRNATVVGSALMGVCTLNLFERL